MFRVMRKGSAETTWISLHDTGAGATTWTNSAVTAGTWSYQACAVSGSVSTCSAVQAVLIE